MIYRQLLDKFGRDEVVEVGVIGTGHFATAIITQSQVIAALNVPVVCDIDIDAAKQAYRHAGLTKDDFVVCESRVEALKQYENGRCVIVTDAAIMMTLPIQVVVESTGVPEASARHAILALEHGKHLAMVSKEVDVTVGPILKHMAERAGLIYTAVDGDQHGLLISMIHWAQDLGLDMICGGKALDSEIIFDPTSGEVRCKSDVVPVDPDDYPLFAPVPPLEARQFYSRRRDLIGDMGGLMGYDVVEMAITANATDLVPDVDQLHCPILRIPEIPEVFAPVEDGGILRQRGVIDSVTCLRTPYEAGLGGGVFMVVTAENDYSRDILVTKGLISNSNGKTALIYRPYHLCGVETPVSLLVAGLLHLPTGAITYAPRFDVVAQTKIDLKAGEIAGSDKSKDIRALMRPTAPMRNDAPVPLHMANGNRLTTDVPAGTVLSMAMVAEPGDSTLWALRRQQDAHFFAEQS